jgi:hypothetical protein
MSSLGDNKAIIPLAAIAGAFAAPYLFPAAAGAAGAGAAGAAGAGAAGAGAAGGAGTMAALTGPELFMGTAGGANLAGMGAAAVPASAYAMPTGMALSPAMQNMMMRQGVGMLGQGNQEQQRMPPPQMPPMSRPSWGGGRNAPSLVQASGIGVPQLSQTPQTAGMLRRMI